MSASLSITYGDIIINISYSIITHWVVNYVHVAKYYHNTFIRQRAVILTAKTWDDNP